MSCCKNGKTVVDRIKSIIVGNTGGKERDCGQSLKIKKAALIGNPNVGKSVIFNSLTGAYVTVSNYPGTTVEISRGWCVLGGTRVEIIDTPGMYSMVPITEEERVARNLLLNENPDIVIHVLDAKNVERMLPLTLQLIEAGFTVIAVLNIMDEAHAMGISIDCAKLQQRLGIPVLSTSAASRAGLGEVKKRIEERVKGAA